MSLRLLVLCAATLLLPGSLGCGGGGDGGGAPLEEDHATYEVTYAPEVREISEADGLALLTGDPPNADTLTYTFAPGATAIAALAPGEIAVLGGIAYRRVVSVEDTGAGVVLTTERTTLPEVITAGTIDWAQTVEFGTLARQVRAAPVTVGGRVIGDLVAAETARAPLTYEGNVQGYDVSLTMTPSAGRLDISAVVSLTVLGERRFALEGTGFLEGFQTRGRAVIDDDGISFEAGQNQVRGELRVQAAAFNTGISDELLDVPIGIDIPVQVGPVPLILKIKANINVRLILSVSDSSAEAEVTFRFASDQGITAADGTLGATGALSTGELGEFLGGSADSVAAGMSACLEFPRFELTMLGEFASVGITQNNCASTVFTFDPPCNEVNGSIVGLGLANLGFFGITLASAQVELYKSEDRRGAGQCD